MFIIIIMVVLLIGVAIGLLIGNRRRDSVPVAERMIELDGLLRNRERFESLIQANQLIEAIKLYRSETGASLKEATSAVRSKRASTANGYGVPVSTGSDYPANVHTVEYSGGTQFFSDKIDWSLRDEVVTLLRQHGKIQAIKVYRERTGASLVDAKGAVDAIAAELPRQNDPLQY